MSFTARVVLGTIVLLTLTMLVLVWAAGRSLRRDLEVQSVQDLLRLRRGQHWNFITPERPYFSERLCDRLITHRIDITHQLHHLGLG